MEVGAEWKPPEASSWTLTCPPGGLQQTAASSPGHQQQLTGASSFDATQFPRQGLSYSAPHFDATCGFDSDGARALVSGRAPTSKRPLSMLCRVAAPPGPPPPQAHALARPASTGSLYVGPSWYREEAPHQSAAQRTLGMGALPDPQRRQTARMRSCPGNSCTLTRLYVGSGGAGASSSTGGAESGSPTSAQRLRKLYDDPRGLSPDPSDRELLKSLSTSEAVRVLLEEEPRAGPPPVRGGGSPEHWRRLQQRPEKLATGYKTRLRELMGR